MKVLFINHVDYANLCYNLSKSLRSIGVQSESLTLKPHQFGYTEQSTRVSQSQMMEAIKNAECVIIGHSFAKFVDWIPKSKRVFVIHTGTRYRQDSENLNAIFDKVVERTFTDSPEFMELGAKLVTYVATAIDTEKIQQKKNTGWRIKFAHYPSNPDVKGTSKIVRMMSQLDADFETSNKRLHHEENLQRMSKCDVYIEMFATEQNGKIYGNAGVTAWEAAAMGKPVITNFLHDYVYRKAYGELPFFIANSEIEFNLKVENLNALDRVDYKLLSDFVRNTIVERHSFEATGRYLLQYLQ